MALVPRGPSEVALYNTRWLTRSQERHIVATIRERNLEQEGLADHYVGRQRDLGRQAQVVVDGLTDLNADIRSKLAADDSPKLEDALEEVYETTKNLSLHMLKEAYG